MNDPLQSPLPKLSAAWLREVPKLQSQLLDWYTQKGRHHLPWKSNDPYAIWISEIMLQQTQVSTVIQKYNQWMRLFPTIEVLASSNQEEVMKCWEGLGYYTRARNIYKAAQILVKNFQGKIPEGRLERLSLPGIGPSTASAIGAFAFGKSEAIFDGNVRRVWARWWGKQHPTLTQKIATQKKQKKQIEKHLTEKERIQIDWSIAQSATPLSSDQVKAWTQAIMDLGATICTQKKPKCQECPWQKTCKAHLQHQEELYPLPKKKIVRQEESLKWAWITNEQGQIAICKPSSHGKWAGLWRLPELDSKNIKILNLLGKGKQNLTHRQILWELYKSQSIQWMDPNWVWVNLEQWNEKAWPRFIRQWWDHYSDIEKNQLFLKNS